MKAVIMAGGKGTRLRPLTCDTPKPMARICGKPVIEYIIELLIKNGFNEAYVTLGYLPKVITDYFENTEHDDFKLNFITEENPLGTAGSVKVAAKDINEPFLVISGDAMCDFDIKDAYEHHKKSKAPLTIIAKTVDDPREYGLINVKDGYVEDFSEKPSWNNVTTNIANTGMYIINPDILELIPENRPYDFACDLFPKILEQGKDISVYIANGYWCDIGDLNSLLQCQKDVLNGICNTSLKSYNDGIFGSFKRPEGNYKIFPPVFIGDRVTIGEGAIIGPNSTLESGTVIGDNARINSSIIMKNSVVGNGSGLTGAILCDGASISSNCSLFEGAVVGSNATISKNSEIHSNVYIWPEKTVRENTIVSENVKFGNATFEYFDDEGISGEIGIDITPDFCARLGAAIGSLKGCDKIGIGCDHSVSAKTLKNALCSGVSSTGVQVWDFGELLLSQMNFSASFCGLFAVIYISTNDNKCTIRILSDEGLNISRSTEREITALMQKCDFIRCNNDDYKEISDLSGIKLLYQQEVYQSAPNGLSGTNVIVECENAEGKTLFEDILSKLGCGQGYPNIIMQLSPCGTKVSATTESGVELSFDKILALACLVEFKDKKDVYLPYNSPKIIGDIANEYGQKVFYYDTQSSIENKEFKSNIVNSLWLRDGIQIAVRLLSYINSNNTTLDKLAKEIPQFSSYTKEIYIAVKPSLVMDKLNGNKASPIKGVVAIENDDSNILIRAGKKGNIIRLFAESYSTETALELCDDIECKIRSLLDNDDKIL